MQSFATLFMIALALTTACDKPSASQTSPDASATLAAAPTPSASASASAGPAGVQLKRIHSAGAKGPVSFAEYAFSTTGASGSVWVARVDLAKSRLTVVQAKKPRALEHVVDGKLPQGDHVAINGSFYGRDDRPMGWVVDDGRQLAPKTRSGGSGIFLVQEGAARIVHRDAPLPTALPQLALQSIDRLVDAGKSVVRFRPGMRRDARSAVAVRADGEVLFIAVFDAKAAERRPGGVVALNEKSTTSGLTLAELAEVLAAPEERGGLGVKTALNLDGGFSTAMLLAVADEKRTLLPHRKTTNALIAAAR